MKHLPNHFQPSFCSEKATTQFGLNWNKNKTLFPIFCSVFDGCTVQGDSVFIGDSFVRKLSAGEQRELVQFEAQFTAYQEAIAAGFKKVDEMGKEFTK
jgi:hypothetical protein